MTERRAHWDIDLIEGVGRRLIPRYRSIGYCTDAERHRIYALIEFIEDWQDANGFSRAGALMHRDGLTPEQAADKLTRLTEDMGLYEDGAT